MDRVSDTEVRFKLTFDGKDFDADAILTFTVGAEEITGYNGQALTAQIPVTATQKIKCYGEYFAISSADVYYWGAAHVFP